MWLYFGYGYNNVILTLLKVCVCIFRTITCAETLQKITDGMRVVCEGEIRHHTTANKYWIIYTCSYPVKQSAKLYIVFLLIMIMVLDDNLIKMLKNYFVSPTPL